MQSIVGVLGDRFWRNGKPLKIMQFLIKAFRLDDNQEKQVFDDTLTSTVTYNNGQRIRWKKIKIFVRLSWESNRIAAHLVIRRTQEHEISELQSTVIRKKGRTSWNTRKGGVFSKPSEWPPKVSLFRFSRTATRMPIIFKIVLTADIKVSPQESIGKDFHRLAHHFGKRVAEDLIYQVLRGSR